MCNFGMNCVLNTLRCIQCSPVMRVWVFYFIFLEKEREEFVFIKKYSSCLPSVSLLYTDAAFLESAGDSLINDTSPRSLPGSS